MVQWVKGLAWVSDTADSIPDQELPYATGAAMKRKTEKKKKKKTEMIRKILDWMLGCPGEAGGRVSGLSDVGALGQEHMKGSILSRTGSWRCP